MSRRTLYASELLGTYFLVLVGSGTAAAVSLVQGMTQLETFLVIGFSFGTTVAVIIMLLGRFSGAHIDPAITVAHTIAGKTGRELLVPYVSLQIIGALFAGFTLKVLFDPYGSPASLGTTKLAEGVSIPVGILLEALGTFVLAMSGFAASSRTHRRPLEAAVVGTTLFLIILLLGPITNASLNPARSLGPAVASGYLTNLYVYWAGPLAGGFVAGITDRFLRRKLGSGSCPVRLR